MKIPQYVAFELTDVEEGYPYAVAWSLADGQYKSVLIQPEDDWLIDYVSADTTFVFPGVQQLKDQGKTVVDIIKEWQFDFADNEIYCQDPLSSQYCLELMYQACNREFEFDVVSEYQCFANISALDFDEQRRWIMATEQLNPLYCEDAVRCFIFLAASIGDDADP